MRHINSSYLVISIKIGEAKMDNDRASYLLQMLLEKTPEDTIEGPLFKEALDHAIKNLTFTSKYLKRKLADLKELTGEEITLENMKTKKGKK